MKHTLFLLAFFLFLPDHIFSQATCSNPLKVDLCPGAVLTGQTNDGMGDDAPALCNTTGEDVVYELFAPNGAEEIYVVVTNASASLQVTMEQTVCGGTACESKTAAPGQTSFAFRVNPAAYYYVWVDASVLVTYDISFGGDTGSVFISIPNTQGNWKFDSSGCTAYPFAVSKPYFQVTFNDSIQTNPMTLAPLSVTGRMCITAFLTNTTGIEGTRIFNFKFNPAGYASVTPVQPDLLGFYNAGHWLASGTGPDLTYKFIDDAGKGKGDFNSIPNVCLAYTFCFDLIPLSNDPVLTNVNVSVTSDGFGVGFSGIVRSGCCPAGFANCIQGGGGNPGNATHTMAFGFDDPGALPVSLLSFTAQPDGDKIILRWITSSEINNDYFTIEKSANTVNWSIVKKIKGAGNTSGLTYYEYPDIDPLPNITYYRLRQTDFDGTNWVSAVIAAYLKKVEKINVHPNPVKDLLTVKIAGDRNIRFVFINAQGEKITVPVSVFAEKSQLHVSNLKAGLYLLIIEEADHVIAREKIALAE